ncbi:MAG TPA: hypothetical protein EYQ25_10875 [Planctomycetes bacterium]|nr:hypothetical protein [Planctomycetota bacterium]HIL37102.1 hypothetical protein [Planctomycetota bacterium]
MSQALRTICIKKKGLWNRTHLLSDEEGQPLGTLSVSRNRWGMVVAGEYRPEAGEVLRIRRDPGLLRGQFSLWSEDGEWLGSSLRWAFLRRQIDIWTGSKPLRIVPARGFSRGWRVIATKTGEAASIKLGLGSAQIQQLRKINFELLLFAHFLGSLTPYESFWPTAMDAEERGTAGPKPAQA